MAGRVVSDANVTLALSLNLPYSAYAYRLMEQLKEERQALYALALWGYECVNGLLGMISLAKADELHHAALRWAERPGQSKVYDAQYVALAERLGADLWSADERLVNTLKAQGAAWVHWVGEV